MIVNFVILFLVGEHDRAKEEETRQYFDVSQLYMYKRYQTDSGYGHDIALIRLSRPAILNQAVGLVCLPKQNERVTIDKLCYLTGNTYRLLTRWDGGVQGEGMSKSYQNGHGT